MQPKTFTVSFISGPNQLRGKADVEVVQEDDEPVYWARNIRFDNTREELDASDLVIERELRIKRTLNNETDVADWVDADSEEESELARLIGKAIEKYREGPPGRDGAVAASDDEAAIRALEDKFTAAFNAGDVDAMMKNYIPDKRLVVFDVVPPGQHLGADAYRKAWVGFFAHFRGTPKIAITDLGITVDGNLGFSHSVQHVTGIDVQGHPVNRTVRVTDGYRKIGGVWLIVLEHVSVPVDLRTGKADLTAKP
jgi:ketosteroid isomerase-like protein